MISRVATLGCWDARKDPRIVERVVLQNNFRSQSMLKRPSSTLDDLEVKRRPQTTWERIQNFPKGTKILYLDCLRYKSIHDASRTPLNAWTVKHPHRKRKDGESEFFIHKNERRPGRIPRRQYEQQRRLQNDIRIMAPLAAVCTIPFFGYIPLLLAITVPRQVLSHHFHNDHEYAMYARTEYRQRRNAYMDIGECFWPTMLINIKKTPIPQSEEDMAGPIFDGMIIYSAFTDDTNIVSSIPNLRMQQGSLSSINALPREYLVKFSLAVGINQFLPDWASSWVATLSPSWWLRSEIKRIAYIVCHDDELLLEEDHALNGCHSLTDIEVMEACLLRGLPITNDPIEDQREYLTNHLKMVEHVKKQVGDEITEGFKLFTLHLAPLRYHLKRLKG